MAFHIAEGKCEPTRVWPDMQRAAWPARKTAAMAMSHVCCMRPRGSVSSIASDVPPSSFAMPGAKMQHGSAVARSAVFEKSLRVMGASCQDMPVRASLLASSQPALRMRQQDASLVGPHHDESA